MSACSRWFAARLASSLLLGWTMCGCTGKPYLSAGDANSAEVGYGGSLAAATEVAKEHCARYEKAARFLDAQENIAYFACERH